MTVCIAVKSFEQGIVGVCDSSLGTADMSADRLAIKVFSIGSSWLALYSANDMSPVIAIRNAIRSQLSGQIGLTTVVGAFQTAFRTELMAKAENTILAPFGINMKEFRQSGLASFGPEIFSRLFYQIEQQSLEVAFLVFGFENEEPHIFSIQDRGAVTYFDEPGFWAIGTGQTSALGSLFNYRSPIVYHSMENVLYAACKAKFLAESATGVGRDTVAIILRSNGDRSSITNEIEELRQSWEQNKPPEFPKQLCDKARSLIKQAEEKPTPSASQKSTSAQ